MPKLAPADIGKISDGVQSRKQSYRKHLMLCSGTGCHSAGSRRVRAALEKEIAQRNLQDQIEIVPTGCNGFCAQGPILVVQPEGVFYNRLKEEDVPQLVEEHLVNDRPVERLMFRLPGAGKPVPLMKDIAFFNRQRLIALRNRGMIDPERIGDYMAREGYRALAKALTEMTPEQIIAEIKESGLRGRGGAGFPTGRKWELCRQSVLAQKEPAYVICNGDEGDPGAFMDRSIIESDPHSVLEGMIIGARAIGAFHGYAYVRNEYPLAVSRMQIAIDQAREYGLLGEDILGTGFDFDVTLQKGAGAFVCGEETSLIASLEGRSPEPRQRPPFPAQHGLWGKPTNINNVETWATVPTIMRNGAEWFAAIGTGTSKGTKVFSLVGKVKNTGLVEVPMGMTVGEIVHDIGGGIAGDRKFKAVQTGGPSGGCIPASLSDLPVDYERVSQAGSIMGSGGMIVMDEGTCMVDIARYFMGFLREESCGKCFTCRKGIQRMHELLSDISEGKGTMEQLALLEELAPVVRDTVMCGLGQTAANPVLSTIRYFRDEYVEHIEKRKCRAGVCKALITYSVSEKCRGCQVCKRSCPAGAITGEIKKRHVVDAAKCVRCGACRSACKFDAVVVA